MTYIQRTIEPVLRRTAAQFPVIALTGPRQSGKTTLLRHVFASTHRYVSLEAPDVRTAAINDPRTFLALNPAPVLFDEIQYAPNLMSYIKERVDERRDIAGQYILTGSQNLLLTEKVTQSLAGRVGILRLLPFSHAEAMGTPERALPWKRQAGWIHMPSEKPLWGGIVRGSFPELVRNPAYDAHVWHSSYVQTYLERDVRSLRQIGDLTQFQSFLRAMALRSGQLLNVSEIARDLGLTVNTVKAWIAILEATFQVVILRPYFRNAGKRLVKTPKIFFTDTGTLCYLAGIRDEQEARESNLSGALFETAVFGELLKGGIHLGEEPRLYFWRTADGEEVDFVIDEGKTLIPVEAKSSSTPTPKMTRGIVAFQQSYKGSVSPPYVVHTGESTLPLGAGTTAVPFDAL